MLFLNLKNLRAIKISMEFVDGGVIMFDTIAKLSFFLFNFVSITDARQPASNVTPEHYLGTVKVVALDLKASLVTDFSIYLHLQNGRTVVVNELNKPYLVAEQLGAGFCLEIAPKWKSHPVHEGGKFCGFSLRRGEVLEIKLKEFQIFSKDTYSVDVGPMMRGNLAIKPEGASVWSEFHRTSLFYLQSFDFKLSFISPIGTIRFTTSCLPSVLNNCSYRKEFSLASSLPLPIVF
jgi:hypothetical protein